MGTARRDRPAGGTLDRLRLGGAEVNGGGGGTRAHGAVKPKYPDAKTSAAQTIHDDLDGGGVETV